MVASGRSLLPLVSCGDMEYDERFLLDWVARFVLGPPLMLASPKLHRFRFSGSMGLDFIWDQKFQFGDMIHGTFMLSFNRHVHPPHRTIPTTQSGKLEEYH
ncbi:hypothetical protein HBI31_212090 [Parastagonospora nodorum]|nr:hypothetical protein HBI31_212090 [Parastagonospora nodorum]